MRRSSWFFLLATCVASHATLHASHSSTSSVAPAAPTSPTAIAQEESAQPAAADHTKRKRRVLRLRNGAFLRDVTRKEDDRWWFGPRKQAQSIPAHFVVEVHDEKALLRAFQDLRKQGKRGAAALAQWGFDHGLLKEGLQALDRALRSHAQRRAALDVLQAHRRYLPKVPSWIPQQTLAHNWKHLWSWLEKRHTPAMETLAAQHFAGQAGDGATQTPEERAQWMGVLTQATETGSAPQRRLALHALKAWRGAKSAPQLQRFALLDRSEEVRLQAGWLLGTLNEARSVHPLIDLVTHENATVRVRAAQALGQAGYAAAVPALVASLQSGGSPDRVPHAHVFFGKQTAYVQDFDVEVAAGSSVADPIVNVLPSGVVLDAGVRSISIERHLIEVRRSLHQITGHRPGATARSWNRWLERYPTVDAGWRAPWPTAEVVASQQTQTPPQ